MNNKKRLNMTIAHYIAPALTGVAAAASFGGDILSLGRATAGLTVFSTLFGAEKRIENITLQATDYLNKFSRDWISDRLFFTKDIALIAAQALALYAGMYAVSTALSLASLSIGTFSLNGALGLSFTYAFSKIFLQYAESMIPQKNHQASKEPKKHEESYSLKDIEPSTGITLVGIRLTDIFKNGNRYIKSSKEELYPIFISKDGKIYTI